MARRYSGDVELRMRYDPSSRRFVGTLRAPGEQGEVEVCEEPFDSDLPEAYDRAAEVAIRAAEDALGRALPVEVGSRGELVIRRMFQAPCPVLTPPPRRIQRHRGGTNRGKRT